MMRKSRYILAILFLVSTSCTNLAKLKNKTSENEEVIVKDPHSYSDPVAAKVTHLDLNVKVDFDSRKLSGSAVYDFKAKDTSKTIIFDTHFLKINGVFNAKGDSLPFELGKEDEIMGQPLKVDISSKPQKIVIVYETTDASQALQWLSPEQTAGKKSPFLYTQSEAILCRSWIPIQDSPGIRLTYSADVHVPEGMMALMSAENPTEKSPNGTYNFKQPNPIPAYLMALAVGDIAFESTGERTGVYAEPSVLKEAAWEFAETEKMLVAAEKLYGPYAWGRYDILVLPPSFPFGGMENPMLTFATPTVIAGDRSLTALIAHEMAHSWSGNLVTNATWNDFWLNEGFTVYFERRIMESVYGDSYTDMLSCLGYEDLELTLADLYESGDTADTRIYIELEGRDPDDGMSDVAYEKGYMFLLNCEKTVGREKWDEFLKKYFDEFKFKSMTTEKFISYLHKNLVKENSEEDKKINIDGWIYAPGLPQGFTAPTSKRFEYVNARASGYRAGEVGIGEIDTTGWTSHEWQQLLRNLKEKLTVEQMKELDANYHFTESGNSEILALWLEAASIHNYRPAYGALKDFLHKVGRRKFLVPLYKAMLDNPDNVKMAHSIYESARKNYHAVSTKTLDELMN